MGKGKYTTARGHACTEINVRLALSPVQGATARSLIGCPAHLLFGDSIGSGGRVPSTVPKLLRPLDAGVGLSFELHVERWLFPYWEALPLHAPDKASFSVAVRLEGQWSTNDKFRLGIIPVIAGRGPSRSLPRVRERHGYRVGPPVMRHGFALDPLSGCWISAEKPLDYQSLLVGLKSRVKRRKTDKHRA